MSAETNKEDEDDPDDDASDKEYDEPIETILKNHGFYANGNWIFTALVHPIGYFQKTYCAAAVCLPLAWGIYMFTIHGVDTLIMYWGFPLMSIYFSCSLAFDLYYLNVIREKHRNDTKYLLTEAKQLLDKDEMARRERRDTVIRYVWVTYMMACAFIQMILHPSSPRAWR